MKRPTKRELEALELLPKEEGAKRVDDLLRRMLATPPAPYTPKPKQAKRAK